MANILITGANGQLGKCFQSIENEFETHNLILSKKTDLDILNLNSIEELYNKNTFDGIINCAAYTQVDKAEIEKQKAYSINAEGVSNLISFAEKKKLFIIHFSTDYVYEGSTKYFYIESDKENPVNYYGKTKYESEKLLKKAKCPNIIFRISWLFSPFGSNFVKTILRETKNKDEIKIVNDQWGRATYGIDLARVVLNNIDNPLFFEFNCYNYAQKNYTSWYDFAKKIIEKKNVSCIIKPCLTGEYPTLAKRPQYSILDTLRIENHLSLKISTWQNALERCLKRIYPNE